MSSVRKCLISIAAASELIGISRATGYEWARRDEFPGLVRLGGRYYVVLAALERFLDGQCIERLGWDAQPDDVAVPPPGHNNGDSGRRSALRLKPSFPTET